MAATTDLKAARDNLAALVKAKTDDWLAAGCPPTIAIDGESYNWDEWLRAKLDAIDAMTLQISKISSPWLVRSSGRA